jgi:5-methylcytosine-specific restriction enzyme subunit McrC
VKIPIRNVYYLLLYAWDKVGEGEDTLTHEQVFVHLHDLFAHVLCESVARLLARGLDRQYQEIEEVVAGVRGKLDLSVTLKRNHLASARTHCRFDELKYDVLHNRILKATLLSLLSLDLQIELRPRVRRLYQKLDTVSDVRITRRDFGRVQVHRNNRGYDFALRLCLLIHENLMIAEGTGRSRFRDFRDDPQQMGVLFQAFVRNFFTIEQNDFAVSAPHVAWYDARGTDTDLQRLPRMETDVVLESVDRCVILDTKFYAEALRGRSEQKKVDSSHLYQIFAYVENRAAKHHDRPPHEGMLLYPVIDEAFAFDYRLKGHRISIRSIDLNQPWLQIREDMLRLLDASGRPDSISFSSLSGAATRTGVAPD